MVFGDLPMNFERLVEALKCSGDDGVFHLCHLAKGCGENDPAEIFQTGKAWLPCPTVSARAKNAKISKRDEAARKLRECHWIKQSVCNRNNSISSSF